MRKIKGFTMIELLIVIAVLGVLAIAVLSAINPIEQINRGRDTGSRSDAEQLLNAIDRYNAAQMTWPWQCVADSTDSITPMLQVTETWTENVDGTGCTSGGCLVLEKLAAGGTGTCTGTEEIKQSFADRIVRPTYNDLYVYYEGTAGDSVYVCFNPQSGSFTDEADRRCTDFGGTYGDFPSDACGSCPTTGAGDGDNCICLP